jgi:hypothetical protein
MHCQTAEEVEMNKIAKKMRDRRQRRELYRAIDGAYTPTMRDELITIAQRQLG